MYPSSPNHIKTYLVCLAITLCLILEQNEELRGSNKRKHFFTVKDDLVVVVVSLEIAICQCAVEDNYLNFTKTRDVRYPSLIAYLKNTGRLDYI